MIHSSCEGVPCAVKRDCPKWGAISFYVLAIGGVGPATITGKTNRAGRASWIPILTAQVNNKFTDE